MANALQLVLSNPRPGMAAEFAEWSGGSHLIHGVQTPGVLSGQRFRRIEGPWPSGVHDYLMIWELDDPAFTLAELAKVKGSAEMPISPAINMDTVQPPTMWRRAEVRSAARSTADSTSLHTIVFGLYNASEGQSEDFVKSLLYGVLARLADLPGVRAAQYLTLADEQIRGNCRKYPHGLVIELEDEQQGLTSLTEALATLPYADPDRWMAIVFRPLDKRMTKQDADRLTHP